MNVALPPPTPTIHRLSPRLINQIAAGEVVTRPAAALKELIENSLDAGAGRVEITVEDDALSFSIRDDGVGMSEEDLRLSIERHATSKIRELDDLMTLTTRGFRGEALAAIAAVSRVEIVTCRRGSREGRRLRSSGGKDPRLLPCGAPEGTTVVVRDLFFNTPARLKFLKNAVAEWGHMLQAVVRQALTRPDVGFSIRWRGKPYLTLPPGQSLIDRLAQVLPPQAAAELIPLDLTLETVQVQGAVTGPRATRRDRRHQFFFVNGRPIVFRPLHFAAEEAFRGLIMTQRYPMGAIFIRMPGEEVDVNVHPTKEEVRFRNEPLVTGAVHRAVVEALRASELVPRLQLGRPEPPPSIPRRQGVNGGPAVARSDESVIEVSASPAPGNRASATGPLQTRQLDFVQGFGLPPRSVGADSGIPASEPHAGPVRSYADPVAREEAGLIDRLRRLPDSPRALAQVGDCYILAAAEAEGMLLIDQHAAHEKILYLQFLEMLERHPGAIEIQPLLVPHTVDVAPSEAGALETILPELRRSGFDVEPFGGGSFVVQSAPVMLERLDVPAFLRDLIDDLGQGDLSREIRRLRERICARAACRAAVKAGDRLTLTEMQKLLDRLMQTSEALRCPHGRPTVLLLTREQIDRQFGRI